MREECKHAPAFQKQEEKGVSNHMDRIKDLPGEEWRAIAGYGGKYLCSSLGRIKSLKHTDARILKTFINNKGYERVCLCRFGQPRYWLVSRLVA